MSATPSSHAKLFAGLTFLAVPSIEFGGTFLLELLLGGKQEMGLTDLQRSLFRAGHAHAGVLVLLSLIAQLYLDHVRLSPRLTLAARVAFFAAALLVPGGFFGGALIRPLFSLLWAGVFVLGAALIALGVGLLRGFRAPAPASP